ncbi:predicted protein [Nematostella vectensis]|uniref:LicD/FKTN/FKRP nucleotidyltransferase domain-containing protein n=1 Tax=Nematostella vectensis TaxID=45351 RepID=A7T3I7_NEMVE|nr:predicted protein [Nematostella vectensis]|eukprot:XP_001621577.1 hypothetical protein NEMVEDRAFT_v1g221816 [Nematostella vectensis]
MAIAVFTKFRSIVLLLLFLVLVFYVVQYKNNEHTLQNAELHLLDNAHRPYTSYQPCSDITNCPDVRYVKASHVRVSQLILTRLLRVLALLCDKHGVRYFLFHGTLLGAVRHQGHNPFDNDIDIAIPEEDFHKLQAAAEELPKGMFFQTESTDQYYKIPAYSFLLAKLRDMSSCYTSSMCRGKCHQNGLMVDVSVLPSNSQGDFLDFYKGMKKRFLGPSVHKTTDIYPRKKIKFDGFEFYVPWNYEKMLKQWYGKSYMELPSHGKLFSGDTAHNTKSCEEI